jgi:hypothetical protein
MSSNPAMEASSSTAYSFSGKDGRGSTGSGPTGTCCVDDMITTFEFRGPSVWVDTMTGG